MTTAIATPSITGFSPTGGAWGSSVTISGTGLTGATAVTFNGKLASFTVLSDTTITAIVPTGSKSGPIGVQTPAGSATSSTSFTVTKR